jgi:hypothetical protein
VVKRGLRHFVDHKSRRDKSYFRIGWDWVVLRARLFDNKTDRVDGKEGKTKETREGLFFIYGIQLSAIRPPKYLKEMTVNRVAH